MTFILVVDISTTRLNRPRGQFSEKGQKVVFIVRSKSLLWQRLTNKFCLLYQHMMPFHWLSQSLASFGLAPKVLMYVQS